jgi:sugar phosphate isomerase/epimerase
MNISVPIHKYVEQGMSFPEAAEKIKEQGFTHASISIVEGLDEYKPHVEELKNSGLIFEVHATLVDINLASFNRGIRAESVRQVRDDIEFASEIGCKLVTFHPGKMRNFVHEQAAYDALFESLEELVPFAVSKGITLCIEHMEDRPKDLCRTMTNMKFVLEKFPISMTLDCAHCIMNNIDPIQAFKEFRSKIKVIHLSGVSSKRSHVEIPLGESEYDFTEFIKEISDFEGPVRIENRTLEQVDESVKFIKKIINNN